MTIYGTALLAACVLFGLSLGRWMGALVGIDANVGGVGIAMLCLIAAGDQIRRRFAIGPSTDQGVLFWGSIYVPVVVAMAAKVNVMGAVDGGVVALASGLTVVFVGFVLLPLLAGNGSSSSGHGDDASTKVGVDSPLRERSSC